MISLTIQSVYQVHDNNHHGNTRNKPVVRSNDSIVELDGVELQLETFDTHDYSNSYDYTYGEWSLKRYCVRSNSNNCNFMMIIIIRLAI